MTYKKPYVLLLLLLLLFMALAQGARSAKTGAEQILSLNDSLVKSSLRGHVDFLADDLFKGRAPGTTEYEIAAHYVANQFKAMGLNPGTISGRWIQPVPLLKSTIVASSVKMSTHSADQNTEYQYIDQFVSLPGFNVETESVRGALVYVGYGINAPELEHEDYKDVDVKGKVVAMLAGKPSWMSGDIAAYSADLRVKLAEAESHGAVAVLILQTPAQESVNPYEQVVSFSQSSFLRWKDKTGKAEDSYAGLKGVAFANVQTSETLLSEAGLSLSNLDDGGRGGVRTPGFNMGVELSLSRRSQHQTVSASNVIAVLEGCDPVLKHEYLVYSAHLDHLGVKGIAGDRIHNGALDNAAGVAIMLETARYLSKGVKPRRSIIFAAVTAEEKGLLGSDYFVRNPVVPIDSIVANVNLDMPLILYPFAGLIAFGAQYSSLRVPVESAATALGYTLSEDPFPEQSLFLRSDQFSFVKRGIPSVYLAPV